MTGRAFLGWSVLAGVGLAIADRVLHKREVAGSRPTASDDVTALARVIASEVGRGTPNERTAIAWAVQNRAHKRGVSIVRLVCTPWCGPQHEAHASMRPFSSAQVPTREDMRLAAAILAAPQADDPTGGAVSFIEPALQDQLTAKAKLGYHLTYAQVRAKWIAEGQRPLGQVGRFEMWA